MKKIKMIVKAKNKLKNSESFIKELEEEIEYYINQDYEIKASNMTTDGQYYSYIYVLLEKND